MTDKFDDFKNIYTDSKTKEDALLNLERGLFYKQNRIEEIFYQKFVKLRKKIHKVLNNELDGNSLDYDVYVNSILVDCRAIFLENKNYKFNSTLQNSYRTRNFDDFANGIDELFERKITGDKTLKEIIKMWVDKRVVHYDYLEPNEEKIIFDDLSSILDREALDNLFHDVLLIAQQYEEIKAAYGKNAGEQFEKVLKAFTGGLSQ